MTNVVRTIHPVGHGAFYTEVFNRDSDPKMVVYDCGSKNITHLNSIIDKITIEKPSPKFDAIFVSHFHADHIAGISELFIKLGTPKYIFVPWLDYDHALLEFGKVLSQGLPSSLYDFAYSLILAGNIQGNQHTNQTTVTRVTSAGNNVLNIIPEWEYIPIVHIDTAMQSIAKKYQETLLAAYHANNIDDLIRKIPSDFEKAKEIFKNVISESKFKNFDFNTTSLILYSGPVNKSIFNEISQIPTKTFLGNKISFKVLLPKTKSSAMYFGDIKMSQSILKTVDSIIGQNRKDKVCLVQMPHHGATSSHDPIYTKHFVFSKIFFCCVRPNDEYHPGSVPMIDVMSVRKYLCVVDDETKNALIEEIEF